MVRRRRMIFEGRGWTDVSSGIQWLEGGGGRRRKRGRRRGEKR